MVALLEVDRLSKHFGGLVANADVSLQLDAGELVGLIGPNGAGKTTLFNCIAGYYRPDGGEVRFRGQRLSGQPPEAICRAGLARTFQIVRVFKDLSVLDNVMVGAFLRTASPAEARRRALDVLAFSGLAERAAMLAGALTIADKKRLEVARALATEPTLLLLDEVMAGLTPRESQDAVALLRALRARGLTILMVEHVMEVLMPVADRVVVLDSGRKIAEDVPARIVQDERVIQAYLGEKYRAAGGEPAG